MENSEDNSTLKTKKTGEQIKLPQTDLYPLAHGQTNKNSAFSVNKQQCDNGQT